MEIEKKKMEEDREERIRIAYCNRRKCMYLETFFNGYIDEESFNKFIELVEESLSYYKNPYEEDNVMRRLSEWYIPEIIEGITYSRNYFISHGENPESDLRRLDHGLEFLQKFIKSDKYSQDTKDISLRKIEKIRSQLSLDIQHHARYLDEIKTIREDYERKKASYDKLSIFGKLVARLNGKKKELEEAQKKASYYIPFDSSSVINLSQYAQYLENIESELSNGGMKR